MLSRFFGKSDKPDDSPAKESAGNAVRPSPKPVPAASPRHLVQNVVPAPSLTEVDFELATEQMSLEPEPPSLIERKNMALDIVELHHQRIANTIRTLWGYPECGAYINKLIMAGGDGMGQARVGFNQDAVQAMLELSDLHDVEFGPPEIPGSVLGF